MVKGAVNRILIVDDQPEVRTYVRGVLQQLGYEILEASDYETGLKLFRDHAESLSIVILDLDFGPRAPSGLELLRQMKALSETIPVLILTGKGSATDGARAIQLGATEVLEKDLYIEKHLEASVEKIRRLQKVVEENRRLTAENQALRKKADFYESEFRRKYSMVGESRAFRQVVDEARRVAAIPRPVLIRGERGTGKELIAALIHYSSECHDGPFVTVNCASFNGNLLESELFGHEKGAFTGADRRKIGRFELASGGTLFLDEIGNMATEFQEKILRVLEYKKFERVAGTETVQVNVRLVAATNADLETLMDAGRFRRDLYDRLSFKVLRLPPLRERLEDIPLVVEHFRQQLAAEVPWLRAREFSPEALDALAHYDWPGNVRELKNVVERLLCASDKPRIDAAEVRLELGDVSGATLSKPPQNFVDKVSQFELELLSTALKACAGNQRAAADELGLSYDQLRHLYKKYNLKTRLGDGAANS
ncbi:MAG: sigma-54-dependent transcriptional regulator [Planctomycetota bacterium]